MSSESLDRGKSPNAAGVVVARPRAGDAIGQALRGAYSGDFGLPDDMLACLRRLDTIEYRRPA